MTHPPEDVVAGLVAEAKGIAANWSERMVSAEPRRIDEQFSITRQEIVRATYLLNDLWRALTASEERVRELRNESAAQRIHIDQLERDAARMQEEVANALRDATGTKVRTGEELICVVREMRSLLTEREARIAELEAEVANARANGYQSADRAMTTQDRIDRGRLAYEQDTGRIG